MYIVIMYISNWYPYYKGIDIFNLFCNHVLVPYLFLYHNLAGKDPLSKIANCRKTVTRPKLAIRSVAIMETVIGPTI